MKNDQDLIEVFRISPIQGNYYETAVYDKREGRGSNTRYFCKSDKLMYVGKHIRTVRIGPYGDGQQVFEEFELDGKLIQYTYEGTTCFRQVDAPLSLAPN